MERQELHCHNCDKYVQFDVDMDIDGECSIICPVCGHEHLRVVKNGIITEERWGTTNLPNYTNGVYNLTTSSSSTFTTYTSASSTNSNGIGSSSSFFTYGVWMNSTSSS